MRPRPFVLGRTLARGARACLALALGLTGGAGSGHAEVDPLREEFVAPRLGEAVDRLLTEYERYGFSGTVLVSSRGLVALHKSYGLADRAHGRPLRVDDAFPIGALERQLAVAAILRLQADGRLSLQDPLARYLPDPPPAWRERSIMELLEAGGSGATLFPELVAAASGVSYESFVTERLILPSRMRASFFLDDPPAGADTALATGGAARSRLPARLAHLPMPRQAIQLARKRLAERAGRANPTPAPLGGRGLASTAGDLFRWELAVRGGSILPEAERSAFLALGKDARPLGWDGGRSRTRSRLLALAGAPAGFDAAHLRYIDDEMTVIVLANTDMGWSEAVRACVEELVFGEDYSFPFAVLAVVATFLLLRGAMRANPGRRGRRRRRGLPWGGLLPR